MSKGIQIIKENGLDPYEYLKCVFTKAPNLKENESIDILLIETLQRTKCTIVF